MRILVLATPRSGGYYFTKSLADTYKLKFVHEPEYKEEFDEFSSLDNVCIKLHLEQLHKYYIKRMSKEDSMKAICTDIQSYNFDKVFILDRRNVTEHIEALINVLYYSDGMKNRWNPNDEEFKTIRDEKWSKMSSYVNEVSIGLDVVATELGISKIYYEDLYYNTEIVDLQGLEFKPDTNRKLRMDEGFPLI